MSRVNKHLLSITLWLGACGARSELFVKPADAHADAAQREADADAAQREADADADADADAGEDVTPDINGDATPDAARTDVPRPPVAVCGNGVREPGEVCDLGVANRFIPAFALEQRGVEAPVALVVRRIDITRFYDYRSASAHTGFEIPGITVTMLFVDASTNDLGLIIFTGHDDVPGVPEQPSANWNAVLSGVPSSARLAVSDDPGEFTRTAPTEYRGNWSFQQNTDGGAIAGLPWNTPWRIVITSSPRNGISGWRYSQQDRSVSLVSSAPASLIHRTEASLCRPDCIAPRCGDGFVDGDERCDDNNTRGGDGCAADCQQIN